MSRLCLLSQHCAFPMQSQLLTENPQCVKTSFVFLQKPKPGLRFLPSVGCELLGAGPSKLCQAGVALGAAPGSACPALASPRFGSPPGLTIWGLWRGELRVSGDGEAVSWLWLAWGRWCLPPAHLGGAGTRPHVGLLHPSPLRDAVPNPRGDAGVFADSLTTHPQKKDLFLPLSALSGHDTEASQAEYISPSSCLIRSCFQRPGTKANSSGCGKEPPMRDAEEQPPPAAAVCSSPASSDSS